MRTSLRFALSIVQHGNAVAFRRDGPLPAQLPSIRRIGASSFASVGSLVQRPVECHVVEVEPHDPVERGDRLCLEVVEHPGVDPFVTASAQRCIGHLAIEDRFDVDPLRTGHQPDH
jgi:hypothetical protein